MAGSFALLDFRVRYTPRRPGEAVCAVGEHPALGCWDPAHSLKLRQLSDSPGVWVSHAPISVPTGITIQYKYLLFHEGAFERWEAFDGNRTLDVAGRAQATGLRVGPADDTFDVLRQPPELDAMSALLNADGSTGGPQAHTHEGGNVEGGSILVVAYILPLLITREVETGGWVIEWNLDSVLARRASAGRAAGRRVVWIGCPGVAVIPADRASLTEALAHFSAVPVFLDPEMQHTFYAGFCRSFLWPVFHNVIKAGAYSHSAWRAYCSVNRLFADKVVEVYETGDMIWAHDYHLLLLPSYTLRHLRTATVGLFLHTPFPSSEIFRTICVRDELLRGMINADVVGFHLFEYARHFLTCCKRQMGLDLKEQKIGGTSGTGDVFLTVKDNERTVVVVISHAGIEPAMLEQVELAANKIDPFREANLAVVNDGLSPRRGPDEGVSPLSLSPPQPRTNSMRKSGSTSHVPTVHFAAQPSACAHLSAPAGGGGYFALAAAHLAQPTNALVRSPLLSALPSPIARNVSDEAAGALLARLDEMTAAGRKIVLEVDEVERLKGLPLALLGWEQMLRTAKRDVRATFVQVGVKARNFTPATQQDYEAVRAEITEILQRIESAHHGAVIFVELPTISVTQRLQLWRRADVTVFTPVREGMNTYPLEAVFARREISPGAIVLSEFACCSRVLNGALRINPWNTEAVAAAFSDALKMGDAERQARRARDMEFVLNNTAAAWAERFVLDLQAAAVDKPQDAQWDTIGFGLAGFHRAGWRTDFTALDTTEVLAAYRRARRRAIFVDWGGTLVNIEDGFNSHLVEYYREGLSPSLFACLEQLASEPRNLLMVLSGQGCEAMDAAFSGLTSASFAAEHGCFFRLGSLPGVRRPTAGGWRQLIEGFDLSWKESARAVMEAYTARTNGAQTHVKGSSLVWKFDEVDPEFGMMQAKEMSVHLNTVLENHPVSIISGKGYVEVRPTGINKGAMVDHVVSQLYAQSGGVDFILCIGDDSADEFMFQALHKRYASKPSSAPPALFTCVVGRKPSAAKYYVNDADEVLELFQSLRLHSTRSNRNLSTSDLNGMGRGRPHAPTQPVGIRRSPLATSLDSSTLRAAISGDATETSFVGQYRRASSGVFSGVSGLGAALGGVFGGSAPHRATVEPPRLAPIASSPPQEERASLTAEPADGREQQSLSVRLSS